MAQLVGYGFLLFGSAMGSIAPLQGPAAIQPLNGPSSSRRHDCMALLFIVCQMCE